MSRRPEGAAAAANEPLDRKRVRIHIRDLRDAVTLMQVAEMLDQGQGFVLASDGYKTVFLPDDMAREGFCREVVIDCVTPGGGMQ